MPCWAAFWPPLFKESRSWGLFCLEKISFPAELVSFLEGFLEEAAWPGLEGE